MENNNFFLPELMNSCYALFYSLKLHRALPIEGGGGGVAVDSDGVYGDITKCGGNSVSYSVILYKKRRLVGGGN